SCEQDRVGHPESGDRTGLQTKPEADLRGQIIGSRDKDSSCEGLAERCIPINKTRSPNTLGSHDEPLKRAKRSAPHYQRPLQIFTSVISSSKSVTATQINLPDTAEMKQSDSESRQTPFPISLLLPNLS